jgi:ankyrin repeat protein
MLLLEKGANVNVLNEKDQTPLYLAAEYGYYKVVKKLLEQGANPNLGPSPLEIATKKGRVGIVHELLAKGAHLGNSSLHYAATTGNLVIIKKLLEAGADVNQFADVNRVNLNTPLHDAAAAGHLEVVKILVANGAKLRKHGPSALREARIHGHTDIKNYLESAFIQEKRNREFKGIITQVKANNLQQKAIALYRWYGQQNFLSGHNFHRKKEALTIADTLNKCTMTDQEVKEYIKSITDGSHANVNGHFKSIESYLDKISPNLNR